MNISRYLIISDVHYGGFSARKNAAILADLESILAFYASDKDCSLVLAGDLFDYWMEYPNGVIPAMGKPLLDVIQRYFGGRCTFLPGNHDVWEYGTFQQWGIRHTQKNLALDGFSKKVLVFHGDECEKLNLPLPALNAFIRRPDFVQAYQKWLPPFLGWFLMKWFSRINHIREVFEFNKTDKVERAFRRHIEISDPETLFISGHEHIEKLLPLKNSCYLNTGNFSAVRTFAYLSAEDVLLQKWNKNTASPLTLSRFSFL